MTTMPKTDYSSTAAVRTQTLAALFPHDANAPPPQPQTGEQLREAELRKQQTLLHATLATSEHFFGPCSQWWAGVSDPRDPRKIIYPLSALLFTGLWLFLCRLGSRRQVTYQLRGSGPAAANLGALLGLERCPHGDTLNETYCRLQPAELQEVICWLVERLLRQKVLYLYRLLDRFFVLVLDGTGIYTFHRRHCPHCLTRTTGPGQTLYYHNVLEAKLVTPTGLVFSLMSEFIENLGPHPTKQDCELRAFYRLAARLKARFPRLPILLVMDSLFAGGPTFALCQQYHWRYCITLQEGDLPTVHQEFAALALLAPDQRLQLRTGPQAQIQQRFRWVNQISYCDSQQRDHTLSVLECRETKPTLAGQPKSTKFMWVTDLTLTKNNIREVADNAGRIRWKIENEGFNVQKNGGFALEPAYSQNATAAKVFYFLLQIAHLLFQLIARGSLLQQFFPRGFGSAKNLATRLLEAWRNALIVPEALRLLRQFRWQIRLDSS
jgi:hypothetical protein